MDINIILVQQPFLQEQSSVLFAHVLSLIDNLGLFNPLFLSLNPRQLDVQTEMHFLLLPLFLFFVLFIFNLVAENVECTNPSHLRLFDLKLLNILIDPLQQIVQLKLVQTFFIHF